MRKIRQMMSVIVVALMMATTAKAQTSVNKWSAAFHVGVEQYMGELGNGFYKFGQPLNGLVGLNISRYLTPHFDVSWHTTYGDMSYDNGTDPVVFTRQNMFQTNLQGRYNILTDAYKWRPYLFAGFGHMRFADGNESQANTIIPYGLGLTYQVTPRIALQLQETFIYSDFDRMDADPSKRFNDSYLQHSIALVFNFGKGKSDADNDGVPDDQDECPGEIGPKSLNGCPDSDGDGVADKDDQCPKVAGTKANNGCPEVKEEDKKVLKDALHGINFETGKDVINESSYPVLDRVVALMKLNPLFKLDIEGHTDSQGDDELNMNLSEKRAQAVKNYLIEKGIEADRLRAKGFGETKPVADNSTEEGRAENRRVELKIRF